MSAHTVAFVVAKGKTRIDAWAVAVDGDTVTPLADVPAEPDVTFTALPPDGEAIDSGALDVAVGFMRGRLKMVGDNAALLHALPGLRAANPQWQSVVAARGGAVSSRPAADRGSAGS